MMSRLMLVLVLGVGFGTGVGAHAQAQAQVQKLGAFLGEWRMKDDPPDSPNRTICQWAPNGGALLCDQIHPGANGPVKELNIFTYDREHAQYVMKGMSPLRSALFTVADKTWTYPGENGRVLNVWESPAVMHYIVQSSTDGTTWTTTAEGRMMRTTDKPDVHVTGTAAALQPLAGTWKLTGARTGTSTCGWSPNGAFLVCDQHTPDADQLLVYSVDGSHVQLRMVTPATGAVESVDVTIADRVWTAANGHVRITRTFEPSGAIRAQEETSADGTTWASRTTWTETKTR